jgi:hypothetical protein
MTSAGTQRRVGLCGIRGRRGCVPSCVLVGRGVTEIILAKNLVDINGIRGFALTMWSLHVSL